MSPLVTFIQSNQLKAWNAVQTDPQFAFLKSTADNISELIQIVDRMGWQSLGEAVEALRSLNTLVEFVAKDPLKHDLSFTRADLKTVSAYDVYAAFQAETPPAAGARVARSGDKVEFSDPTYGQLTKAQIIEIAAKTPTAALKFIPEVMDCDDFTFAMEGWLSSQGLGNTTIGPAFLELYGDGKLLDKHAALIATDSTGNAWWVEPQTGGVHDIQEIYINLIADRVVITDWLV
jgi:hypothetical protein